jgi:hypothetical protein
MLFPQLQHGHPLILSLLEVLKHCLSVNLLQRQCPTLPNPFYRIVKDRLDLIIHEPTVQPSHKYHGLSVSLLSGAKEASTDLVSEISLKKHFGKNPEESLPPVHSS